jgi:quercetin dioxygenase-like cupin family protein
MQPLETLIGPTETQAFERELRREGYADIEIKTFGPMPVNKPHQHPFEVRGFVLDGEATITCEGIPGTYRKGDTFSMQAGVTHTEAYGPLGYRWLIGRRHPKSN